MKDLFGCDGESKQRHSMIAPTKPVVRTALPMELYEILANIPSLPANNPYNRLITAIESWEENQIENDAGVSTI